MCGRYTLEQDNTFYNAAPGQILPVITDYGSSKVERMKWGLIPLWHKGGEKQKGIINIRDDSLLTKAWAKEYLKSHRCLVPATGFYEWKTDPLGKQPYYFHLKGRKQYAFAGVYHERSYAIITVAANPQVIPIHARMPLILKKQDEQRWLEQGIPLPVGDSDLEMYPVSQKINSVSYSERPVKITAFDQGRLLG